LDYPIDKKHPGRQLVELATAWRQLPVRVIGRVSDDQFLMDFRCLEDWASLTGQLEALRLPLS
jgi:L-seryl-tRNA(Ser) seleniumtransferase